MEFISRDMRNLALQYFAIKYLMIFRVATKILEQQSFKRRESHLVYILSLFQSGCLCGLLQKQEHCDCGVVLKTVVQGGSAVLELEGWYCKSIEESIEDCIAEVVLQGVVLQEY